MKNFVQPGEIRDYTPATDVASGAVVIIGTLVGVAASAIAAGQLGAVAIEGVFDLPKKAGTAITDGAKLTWSVADGAFTVGAGDTGDTLGGAVAIAAAASADTVVRAKLQPGTGSTVA
jgi:predicted RecA/RadA family phage recombinase